MDNYEKRFKEVLAKAQEAITDPALKKWIESVFPELKKSDDERIREDIIKCIKYSGIKSDRPLSPLVSTTREEALAWLEKQRKVGWSEKDIKMIDSIIEEVRPLGGCPDYPTDEERDYFYKGQDRVEWLERLKKSDNVKWWPSELQLNYLSSAIDVYRNQGHRVEVLDSLLGDLRKYRRGEL